MRNLRKSLLANRCGKQEVTDITKGETFFFFNPEPQPAIQTKEMNTWNFEVFTPLMNLDNNWSQISDISLFLDSRVLK